MRHNEKLDLAKIKLISATSFFMGFLQAFFIYVMSTYFKELSGDENVSVFYLVGYAITLVCFLNLHKIIRSWGKSDVLFFSILGKILVILALLLSPAPWLAISLMILYIIFGSLEWVSLDVILESYSKDSFSGRIRGKYLTITNSGFLLAPLLSTRVLENYGFQGIFFLLLFFNLLIFFIVTWGLHDINHRFRAKLAITDVIRKVWRRKDILNIYYISFILEFFYALMVIYTPIYLENLGYSWKEIGIIFTWMLVPFVLFQYPAGILADKRLGEKELLIFSIIIMGFSTVAISFISTGTVAGWSFILFATRIGASLIEILRDSYFYKRVDGRNVDLINFFRTARPLGYILASIMSAFLIYFFSVKSIFILVALVVFSALYPAFKLIDNKSERESA